MRRLGVCRAVTVVTLLLPALGLTSLLPAQAAPASATHGKAAPASATHSHAVPASVTHAKAAPARPAGTAAYRAPQEPAADSRLQITLTSVSPTIATPGQAVTVQGTVTNPGSAAVSRPVARVVLGDQQLGTREAVDRWAVGQGPAEGREVGRKGLGPSLAAGATTTFSVSVKNAASLRNPTYGALPLSVEVGDASLRTFAGYQRQKQYQPLRLGWVVPLTLDPDPALFGAEGTARTAAWERVLGASSRLSRVLETTESAPVTWAIDPTLLPSLLPEGAPEPKPTGKNKTQGNQTPNNQTQGNQTKGGQSTGEAAARSAVEERIRAAAPAHSPWVLPDTDADIAAAADAGTSSSLMSELVSRSATVARAIDGRADVAWPVDGRYTPAREEALRRLYSEPRLGAQLAAQSNLPLDANTQDAHRRTADGLPVLGYDDELSNLFAGTSSPTGAAAGLQHFIADTVALLDERPGTSSRSVLVVAPRSFDPDPTAAAAFLSGVSSIPWLEPVSTRTLLNEAKQAVPMPQEVGTRPTPTEAPSASGTDPYAGAEPLLTPRRIASLEQSLRTVRGVGLIRDDGDVFTRTWGRAAEQLASTRWRSAPAGWNRLNAGVVSATRDTTTAIKVSRRNINFIADTGRLQITVENENDVAVENVKLTLEPANPRLRIDNQPPVMRIGANSRATAVVSVTTLAAGTVPIRTTLTTPDGTVIGQGADVLVQVTPTGDWVYWTLGGIAGIILLLGIWRSVRRTPAPRNAAEPVPTPERTA